MDGQKGANRVWVEGATIATGNTLSTAFARRGVARPAVGRCLAACRGVRDWLLSAPLSTGSGHASARVTQCVGDAAAGDGGVTEGCRSGRTGRSRKPLYALRTVGSNPTPSARFLSLDQLLTGLRGNQNLERTFVANLGFANRLQTNRPGGMFSAFSANGGPR